VHDHAKYRTNTRRRQTGFHLKPLKLFAGLQVCATPAPCAPLLPLTFPSSFTGVEGQSPQKNVQHDGCMEVTAEFFAKKQVWGHMPLPPEFSSGVTVKKQP
jgi:hypothetical protein